MEYFFPRHKKSNRVENITEVFPVQKVFAIKINRPNGFISTNLKRCDLGFNLDKTLSQGGYRVNFNKECTDMILIYFRIVVIILVNRGL